MLTILRTRSSSPGLLSNRVVGTTVSATIRSPPHGPRRGPARPAVVATPGLPGVPREPPQPEAVYLYEVNYSALASVVRHNHRLDLTTLFVGLDMAVCASRLKLAPGVTTPLSGGRPAELAKCLQRLAGVFTAATVPILGLRPFSWRSR